MYTIDKAEEISAVETTEALDAKFVMESCTGPLIFNHLSQGRPPPQFERRKMGSTEKCEATVLLVLPAAALGEWGERIPGIISQERNRSLGLQVNKDDMRMRTVFAGPTTKDGNASSERHSTGGSK